eukprot:TCONS_00007703-protein
MSHSKLRMKTLIVLAALIVATLACSDKSSICSRYNKRQCTHPYLKANCAKYCGHCSTGCVDKNTSCPRWAPSYCKTNAYVKANCKKSCNMCGPSTPAPPTSAPGTYPPQGSCGRPQVAMSRVVGGQNAKAHSWPWQIGLHRNGGFMCGGSIINSRWVVTAAHKSTVAVKSDLPWP